ncbi:hypothetical protein HXX76_008248 [Chlamydomonas incerta]|uniref:Glycosyl transferase CAP10 domain-containing protein n=1 Tax=Chlamydomonas incerta TaxID=51695 RepID=A0A835T992_CHLIN|nr:hypothetical protein HXX76_008248 [Chlamydomonas incerta]|eukprot:KAG2433895.1 hypothetical protein HXX76_008248 [Chlamydomonas incerta]
MPADDASVPVFSDFDVGTERPAAQATNTPSRLTRADASPGLEWERRPVLAAGGGLAGGGRQRAAVATEAKPPQQQSRQYQQEQDRLEGVDSHAPQHEGVELAEAAAPTTGDDVLSQVDAVRRRRLRQQGQQQQQQGQQGQQRGHWAEGVDRDGSLGGGRISGGRGSGKGGKGGAAGGGGRSYVLAGGQAGGGGTGGAGGGQAVVTSTRLRYDWRRVVADLQPMLMAALGPEVAYWRRKRPTCADLAHTATQLAGAAPDNLRLVLLRTTRGNTSTATAPGLSWHFLTPPLGAAAAPGALRLNSSGRVRHAWPPLEPAPLGSCDFCHKQLAVLTKRLGGFLSRVAAASAANGGGGGGGGAAVLPDMLFLVNAADNMQRFGRSSRAPLLSLIKWWPSYELPWWAPADTPTSLGRRVGGRTIQPPPQPDAEGAAGGGSSSISNSSLAEAVAEAVAAFLRRPELDDPLQLPALQSWLRRQVDNSVAGAAAAAAAAGAAAHAFLGGDSAVAAAAAAAAQSGDMAAAAVAELDQMRLRGAFDPDLMLPSMVVVPRALHSYPWADAADTAFFSGAPYCPRYKDTHGGDICLRPYLAALAAQHPQDLEVRLTAPWQGPLGAAQGLGPPVRIDASPPTPLADHARRRYLLAPDGYTASSRLAGLMASSSVVLKSRSPFIEWYYRLLTPGSHHLEFWTGRLNRDDVLRALAAARQAAAADLPALQAAVAANRDIAARQVLERGQAGNTRAALLVYHSLFGGREMRACLADLAVHLEDLGRPLAGAGGMGGGGGGAGGDEDDTAWGSR